MPKTRPARLIYALVVCLSLLVIGRNLYHRYLDSQLVAAVEAKNVGAVRSLLLRGADPNTKLLASLSYSYEQMSEEQQRIACLLIEHRAEIHEDLHSGSSYLERACNKGELSVIHCLLQQAGYASFVDAHLSASMENVFDFLGSPNAPSSPGIGASGSPPSGLAAPPVSRQTYVQRLVVCKEMIHLLRQRGAHLTPWQAIQINDLDRLRAALDAGLPLETNEPRRAVSSSTPGPTLLQLAAQNGNIGAVRLLLLRGAEVNAADTGNFSNPSALGRAIRSHHEHVARLLLARGADVNPPGNPSYLPLPLAVLNLPALVPALLEHGADLKRQGVPALCNAMYGQQPAVVTLLLQRGVSCYGLAGKIALSVAIQYRPDLVPLLLQRGANARETPQQSQSVLWEAVNHNREELLLPLLQAGASINASGGSSSPLQEAVGKKPSMVRVLLEHGADPNKAGGYSLPPLIAAAQTGNVEAAQLLLSHGADVNGKGRLPHTPLYYARKHKQEKIISLLQQAGAKE